MYPFWVYWSTPKVGVLLFYFAAYTMIEEASTVVTMKVRVSPDFREKISVTAKANNRSMNAEIVSRLEQSFESHQFEETVEKIPTEVLMIELASRMKGYSLTVSEIDKLSK